MLTTERVDHISHDLADAFAKLPDIITEIREVVGDREKLIMELDEKSRVLDTMNVQISDLRHQIKALQDRTHELVQQNAKLENVIASAGRALGSSESFVAGVRSLAPPEIVANGTGNVHRLPSVDVTG